MDYSKIAKNARLKVLEMVYKAQSSHIGSNFSVIDILTVLFEKADLTKDKIILSAGWKAASFYYFLAQKGFIEESELDTYNQDGSRLIGLTEPGVPGVHFAGGSMGLGLPASVGFALSKKMKGEEGIVYCVMSDGELNSGTTWESALIANHHKLDNLVVIVDANKFQAMGKTEEILNMDILRVFRGFRFYAKQIDGHNHKDILLEIFLKSNPNVPKVFICNTIKGKGVSFMENDNRWHYLNLKEEDYLKAKDEINVG